jgi:transposase
MLEFRRQLVELVRAGRKPSQLAQKFGCTAWSMQRWVNQAGRDAVERDDGLTTRERAELRKAELFHLPSVTFS